MPQEWRTLQKMGRRTGKKEYGMERDGERTCSECGERYHEPFHATIRMKNSDQEYYACPRCLAKVGEITVMDEKEENAQPVTESNVLHDSAKSETGCQHQLGYLRNRPKDTPIPDECLTCIKMVECLCL